MNNRRMQIENLSPEQASTRLVILVISLIGFIATAILTITSYINGNVTETIINGSTNFLLAVNLITAWFGLINFGRVVLPLTALVSITYLAAIGNGIHDPGILAFAIVLSTAALVLGSIGLIIYGTLSVAAVIGIIYIGMKGFVEHPPVTPPDIIGALMALIVSTIILYLTTRRLELSLNEVRRSEQVQKDINQELLETRDSLKNQTYELEKASLLSTRRIEQLRLVANVAKSTASIRELESLITTISDLISQRFGIYHTGIFLLDDSHEYAYLRAANSEGGQRMLKKGHRLQVGTQGIVGSVTATGIPRIALDVGMDSVHFINPDLPNTRSEIALPLKIVQETIGALDLQSVEPNAFSQEDVEVLSILANQVAIAIQNAQSFEAARQAAQDAENAYLQLTGQAWSQAIRRRQVRGYHFDGVGTKSIISMTTSTNGEASLQIPVRLRGQEIGKLKLSSRERDRNWTQDEVAMAQASAERAALALENARLLEDAQRRAAREQVIGEISATVSSSSDMEEILRSAVQELGRKMGGAEVVLELGADLKTRETVE